MAPSVFVFLFILSAFTYQGVDSQTRCYVKNRCTSGDIAASAAECCHNKISDITRGCGHRNSDNCNVFFNKPGGLCRPCVFVGFQHSKIVLSESGYQTIPIVVSSYGAISQFLITAGISSTNATNGVDYSFLEQYFYYSQVAPFDANIDIDIKSDNVALEPVEVLEMSLAIDTEDIFGQHDTTVIIEDSDILNINVSAGFFTVAEGSSVSFTITKDKRTAVDVGIKVTPLTYQQYSKKTATDATLPSLTAPPDPAEERDFNSTAVQLNLGTSYGTWPVHMEGLVNDDDIVENLEEFILLIESSNPDHRIRINTRVINVRIISDDDLVLTLNQRILKLSENSPTALLSITPAAGAVFEVNNVTISYQLVPSSIGDIVFSPNGNLLVSFFSRVQTVLNVTAAYNKILREDENYAINFQPVNNRTGVRFSPSNSIDLTLISNKRAEVMFAIGQATFSEGGGNQIITVILQNAQLARNQNVEVYIDDGTDTGISLGSVTFNTGSVPQNRTVTFPVINNIFVLEPDKHYMLRLRNLGNLGLGDPGTMNITVVDDDFCSLSLERRLYNIIENEGSVEICALLSRGVSPKPMTIYILDVEGTANFPSDYIFYDIHVTLPAFQNRTCATLNVVNDDAKETAREQLSMYIFRAVPWNKNLHIDHTRSVVMIQDDDRL